MDKKFVLVSSNDEENIAVIDLGIIKNPITGIIGSLNADENIEVLIKERISEKLKKVICEHYDFDGDKLKIYSLDVRSLKPIHFVTIVKHENEQHVIHLQETWVY